jgi:hypothetical protein
MSGFNVDPVVRGPELVLDTALGGIATELGKGQAVVVNGTSMSAHELTHELRKFDALYKDVRRLKSELAKARDAVRKARPEVHDFLKAFKAGLVARYGDSNPELAKFGFKPRKASQPLTSEAQAQKTAKARQTRQAHHATNPAPSNGAQPSTGTSNGR